MCGHACQMRSVLDVTDPIIRNDGVVSSSLNKRPNDFAEDRESAFNFMVIRRFIESRSSGSLGNSQIPISSSIRSGSSPSAAGRAKSTARPIWISAHLAICRGKLQQPAR